MVFSEFDDCRFRDKLLRVVELVLAKIVSCVSRAMIKHNIYIWSPRMELALPLSNQRQRRNNQERSIDLSGSLGLQLSQERNRLNCFPTLNMREREREREVKESVKTRNTLCTYSPISSARIGERRFHQLKRSQFTPSSWYERR